MVSLGRGIHIPAPIDFFNEIDYDLTSLSWYHLDRAEDLDRALEGPEVMIVVPVYLSPRAPEVVISSPDSNVTFHRFIRELIYFNHGSTTGYQKGLKIEFKNQNAVHPTLTILCHHGRFFMFPIILHADVLPGPGEFVDSSATDNLLLGDWFIKVTQEMLPEAVLSLGWTSGDQSKDEDDVSYSAWQIREMSALIENSDLDLGETEVTIAVRSHFVLGRHHLFSELLRKVGPTATLTLWAFEQDVVYPIRTSHFIYFMGKSRVYADFGPVWLRRASLGIGLYVPKLNEVVDIDVPQDDSLEDPSGSLVLGVFIFAMLAFFLRCWFGE